MPSLWALVRVTGVEPALLAKLDPKSSASAYQGYALMHKNFVLASMRGISFRHTRVELIIARRRIFVKVFRQLIVAE